MSKSIYAFFLLLAGCLSAGAITGTVNHVEIEKATDDELAETVFPAGALVYRPEDPRDLRVGDGITPGGVGLWNYAALTSPPSVFPHDVYMTGHAVVLNQSTYNSLSIGAEGPLFYLRQLGSNVLTIVSGRDETQNAIVGVEEIGTDQLKITMLNEEGSTAPVFEVTSSITNPVWTVATATVTRLSVNLIECVFETPDPADWLTPSWQFYRVTAPVVPVEAHMRVPLEVPALTVNRQPVLTNEPTFLASASYSITAQMLANWNAAHGWSLTNYIPVSALSGAFPIVGPVTIGNTNVDHVVLSGNSIVSIPSGICLRFGQVEGWCLSSETDGTTNKIIDAATMTINAFPGAEGVWKVATDATTDTDMVNWRSMLRWGAPRTNPVLSGVVMFSSNTTNFYLRPDGGTNTISFDAGGSMVVAVDGVTSLVVRTNGNVGVKSDASANYALTVSGTASATILRAGYMTDTGGGQVDPSGSSLLNNVTVSGTLFLGSTNCWLVTDGTNLFFRNAAGTTNALTSN